MELTREDKIALSDLRYKKSLEMLDDAVHNLKSKRYKTAANRSYYSAFHAARSLLILKGIDPAKHDGVKTMFSLHFIKSRLISLENGKIYQKLMSLRNEADYDDFSEVSVAESEKAVKDAKKFIKSTGAVRKKLKNDLE
jgi:uncharacterized protein (UPF0332 family)